MTEDRLKSLLAEATDLTPSSALRDRVAELRPRPRTPWFALSGVSAALAALAFLAIPREVSAAELVHRADRAVRANLTYQTRYETFRKGGWRVHNQAINAPGWQLCTWPDGRFQLRRPGLIYIRFDLNESIRLSRHVRAETPAEQAMDNDPSPENHVRLLRSLNPGRDKAFGLSLGRVLEEDGRRLREVVIVGPSTMERMRTRYLIDEATNLPVRIEEDIQVSDEWRPNSRTLFTFPGPAAGSEAFTRLLKTAPIVDVDAEERVWTHRLARVERVLRPVHGEPLVVRDLRTLPNGDVLMLYTGPQRVLARLEGANGEAFALCRSIAWTSVYPDRRHPVRLLHFAPLHGDVVVRGPLKLDLTWNGQPNGSFRIAARLQKASTPPWAVAMNAPFGGEGYSVREAARVAALSDRWLDARGRTLQGDFSRDPDSELRTIGMSGLAAPSGAVRSDPKASAEAARVMRRLIAHLAAQGEEEDPFWTTRLLAKLDRRAKG